MPPFDYESPAEFFGNPHHSKRRHTLGYRRFERGSEAVRFAIEELSGFHLAGVILESDEQRYDQHGIRALYDSPDYPFDRR